MNKLHFTSLLLLYLLASQPSVQPEASSLALFAHDHYTPTTFAFPWTKKPKRIVQSKLNTTQFEHPGDDPTMLLDLLQKEAEQNEQRAIKNATLERAIEALNSYVAVQKKLSKLLITNKLNENNTDASAKNKKTKLKAYTQNWQLKRYQKRLRQSFQHFTDLYQQSTWVELMIERQKQHNPALAAATSKLEQPDGEVLPVFVDFRKEISARSNQTNIVGVTLFALENGKFSSTSSYLRRAFPQLPGRKNAIQIYLSDIAKPDILSHELGHIYYLTHRWEAYQTYIKQKGENYQRGGHGADDPCGKAAMLAESGKFPVLEEI